MSLLSLHATAVLACPVVGLAAVGSAVSTPGSPTTAIT